MALNQRGTDIRLVRLPEPWKTFVGFNPQLIATHLPATETTTASRPNDTGVPRLDTVQQALSCIRWRYESSIKNIAMWTRRGHGPVERGFCDTEQIKIEAYLLDIFISPFREAISSISEQIPYRWKPLS